MSFAIYLRVHLTLLVWYCAKSYQNIIDILVCGPIFFVQYNTENVATHISQGNVHIHCQNWSNKEHFLAETGTALLMLSSIRKLRNDDLSGYGTEQSMPSKFRLWSRHPYQKGSTDLWTL